MKIIRTLFTLTAVVLIATACSNDDSMTSDSNNSSVERMIRVAPIVEEVQTRAGMTTDSLKQFQLIVYNPNNSNFCYNRNEVITSNGTWTENYPAYWESDSSKTYVAAYAFGDGEIPSQDIQKSGNAITGFTFKLPNDQSTEAALSGADLLYMPYKAITPKKDLTADGKIKIPLKHNLSKLVMKIIFGTEFNNTTEGMAANPISSITINGLKISGELHDSPLTTDTEKYLHAIGDTSHIIPYFDSSAYTAGSGNIHANANYECIVVPQTVESSQLEVSVFIAGYEYKWVCPYSINFASDNKYTITLTLGKDAVSLNRITKSPWSKAR